MDPDINLEEQREIANLCLNEDLYESEITSNFTRLAKLVIALDEWITKGGALPEEWNINHDNK